MALTLEVSQKDRSESPAPAAVSARTRSRSARKRSSSTASASSLQSHGVSPDGTIALARSCTQPSRELSYSTPLSQPFCEPVRLFSGREPGKLPKDLAEKLPKELRSV